MTIATLPDAMMMAMEVMVEEVMVTEEVQLVVVMVVEATEITMTMDVGENKMTHHFTCMIESKCLGAKFSQTATLRKNENCSYFGTLKKCGKQAMCQWTGRNDCEWWSESRQCSCFHCQFQLTSDNSLTNSFVTDFHTFRLVSAHSVW